ncbi:hypothetical protein PUN28_015850 [Cardiocondyla obscurior]|uniref:Uncharacterized protein n=1 Tax=Cardiocondyla obscurior TaxID=286306 RepID=A0AAW2EPI7_9HYME
MSKKLTNCHRRNRCERRAVQYHTTQAIHIHMLSIVINTIAKLDLSKLTRHDHCRQIGFLYKKKKEVGILWSLDKSLLFTSRETAERVGKLKFPCRKFPVEEPCRCYLLHCTVIFLKFYVIARLRKGSILQDPKTQLFRNLFIAKYQNNLAAYEINDNVKEKFERFQTHRGFVRLRDSLNMSFPGKTDESARQTYLLPSSSFTRDSFRHS